MLVRFKLKPEKCNEQFFRQWSDITGKLIRPTGALLDLVLTDSKWESRLRTMGQASVYHWLLRDQLIAWASEAKAQIKEKSADQTRETRAQYHRWVDSQLRLGAGALHALTKRTDEAIEKAVYVHRAKSPGLVAKETKRAEYAKVAKLLREERSRYDGKCFMKESIIGASGNLVRTPPPSKIWTAFQERRKETLSLATDPALMFGKVERVNFRLFSEEQSAQQQSMDAAKPPDDDASGPDLKKHRTSEPAKDLALSDDPNLIVNFYACHACPSNLRSRGRACGACSTDYAPRVCPSCAIENVQGLWCTECGKRTASRTKPVWQACRCGVEHPKWNTQVGAPPSFCKDCNGATPAAFNRRVAWGNFALP